MGRLSSINRAIRSYDRHLVAVLENNLISIKRKTHTFDVFHIDDYKILASRPFHQHVMDLTDNWNANGSPVEWGLEPIVCRLKAIDLASNPTMMEDLKRSYDKAEETKRRDFKNNVESFLLDFRQQFAKSFNDVNTSTMEKTDKRRLDDGYRK